MGGWVLVVEDQQVDALVVESGVLRAGGMAVRHVPTIAAARRALGAAPPTMVFLDLVLPDGDGSELLTWMREQGLTEVPVIVVSAESDTRRRDALRKAGASEYVVKPLELEAMELVVQQCFERWLPKIPAPAD